MGQNQDTVESVTTRLFSMLEAQLDAYKLALEESVGLQSHYAKLLNMYDGGERIGFENAEAWIARLRECGKLPTTANTAKHVDRSNKTQ